MCRAIKEATKVFVGYAILISIYFWIVSTGQLGNQDNHLLYEYKGLLYLTGFVGAYSTALAFYIDSKDRQKHKKKGDKHGK